MYFDKIVSCFIVLVFLTIISGCKDKEKAANANVAEIKIERERIGGTVMPATLQHALVYKTTKDYSKNVPVNMNADKTEIASYPAPSDIYYQGNLAYPTKLENGYLLDNRGIGPNVAFLSYTYEEYSALKQAPDKETLIKSIIDKNPLVELWDCGTRDYGNDEINVMNALIGKQFPDCKQLITVYKVTL